MNFASGTKFQYGNTAYILLGRIIEKVSGLPYPDYLEKKLLKPLNLVNSGYDDGRKILANAAQAYSDGMDGVVRSELINTSNTYAAGAMYATVDDLLAWQLMLSSGKVLSAPSTAAVFTDGGFEYGLGWFVRKRHARKLIEHGGSLNGFNSTIAYYPGDQLTVIVLSNYGDEVVSKIGENWRVWHLAFRRRTNGSKSIVSFIRASRGVTNLHLIRFLPYPGGVIVYSLSCPASENLKCILKAHSATSTRQ